MEGGSARGASLASKRATGSSRPEVAARCDTLSLPTVGRNCNLQLCLILLASAGWQPRFYLAGIGECVRTPDEG